MIADELVKIDNYFRAIERENPDLAPPLAAGDK